MVTTIRSHSRNQAFLHCRSLQNIVKTVTLPNIHCMYFHKKTTNGFIQYNLQVNTISKRYHIQPLKFNGSNLNKFDFYERPDMYLKNVDRRQNV